MTLHSSLGNAKNVSALMFPPAEPPGGGGGGRDSHIHSKEGVLVGNLKKNL